MDKTDWLEIQKQLQTYPIELRLKYLRELSTKEKDKEISKEIKKEIEKLEIQLQEQRFFKRDSGEFLTPTRTITEEEPPPEKTLEKTIGFTPSEDEEKTQKIKYAIEPAKSAQIKYETASASQLRETIDHSAKSYTIKNEYQPEPVQRSELEILEEARTRSFEEPAEIKTFLKDKTLDEHITKYKQKKEEY